MIELAPSLGDEGVPKPRRRVPRFGGWVMVQILGILIRHYLTKLWDDNGPTC